jgi:hypothetical protein
MKMLVKKLKKFLCDNGEDLKYLLVAGLPPGLLFAVFSHHLCFGDLY